MLGNKRLSIVADTVIDDVRVASFGAILNLENMDLSFTSRHIEKDMCKTYREIIRADQKEFEDYAYMVQDVLKTEEPPQE